MNRRLTNIVRFFMDECLPPILRDNKYFMFPFFYYAYRGKQIGTAMNLKSLIHHMSQDEYRAFYEGLDTISRNRKSDLNESSIQLIIKELDPAAESLLDVGCGKGYLLSRLAHKGLRLEGCDTVDTIAQGDFSFKQGDICDLPFEDNSFDVVTCCHTLEHIPNIGKAVSELRRVARKQIIVVVPRQRPYKYTLDEHLHFFMYPEELSRLFQIPNASCKRVWGDWVYIGSMSEDLETQFVDVSIAAG